MKELNTIYLHIIIVTECVLIIILLIAFVKMFKELKKLPKQKNQVDEEIEKELKNH